MISSAIFNAMEVMPYLAIQTATRSFDEWCNEKHILNIISHSVNVVQIGVKYNAILTVIYESR